MARLGRVLSVIAIGASAALLPFSVHAQTSGRTSARAPLPASLTITPAVSDFRAPLSPRAAGSLNGVVSDERGGPVRGAMVSAVGMSAMATAVSDQNGRYAIDALPAGEYMVRAHRTGFAASRRQAVRVAAGATVVPLLQLRRIDSATATSGTDAAITSRPIVAAGIKLPQADAAAEGGKESAEKDAHPHTETAWRLRHIKRSILKSDNGSPLLTGEAVVPDEGESFFGKALGGAANIASFFADAPIRGEVNLLTSNVFGHGDLFGSNGLPRGIAYLSIGSPTAAGDWTVRAAMSEGDLASWIIAGSFVSKAGAEHSYTVGLSYSTQEYQGGNIAALAAIREGGRHAGEIYAFDRWAATPWLSFDYGARYARYGYLEEDRGFLSPRAGFTLEPVKGTRFSTLVVQRMVAPGAEEFLPRAITGPALPPERTFAPYLGQEMRAERARLVDLQLEHDFGDAYVFAVRRFYQNVNDQLVTLFRLSPEGGPQSVGHYYVGNVGAFDASGWGFRMSSPASARMRASVDYAVATARWTSRNAEIGATVPALVRAETESVHDITTSLHTDIPETATRFYLIYRVNTAFTRADPDARPGFDGRFDVQVNQALPFGLGSTRWEVLVGLRNMFRDANEPASIYDELLVVRPPKRLIGGVLVRF